MEIFNPYFYAANINLLAYEHAWVRYIESGDKNERVLDHEIYESWDRCKKYNIDPFYEGKPAVVEDEELQRRLAKNKYVLQIVEPFMEILFDIINKSEFVVAFSDREGVILKVMAGAEMNDICKKVSICAGADRREHVIGTSSINMAINLKKPIQLTGCQHFIQTFQHYTNSSSPVYTQTGEVLCILSIIGKYESANEHTLGMVYSITKAIENQHHINKIHNNLKKKNNQLETILSMISDSIVYIENQQIIQANDSMLSLIGKDKKEVIGKSVHDTIITQPPLSEVLANNSGYVLLIGKNDSYKCFLSAEDVKTVFEKSYGAKILRFTQVKTIELMVSKMPFSAKYAFEDLIGESPAFMNAICIAKKASQFDSRVIITGESGTGKEMFAQAIHNGSNRKSSPFIAVDCGAIPTELFESEFFGYERGAFTGAKKEGKEGFVEKANHGTLFLDEIGNMSLEMQRKLLRVLQEGVIFRVGGSTPINVDIRVIAATNANLEEEIKNETFREDLYYRLNVFNIKIPSLKERRSDIPLLVHNIIKKNNSINPNIKITDNAMNALVNYNWPGNVRQLQNAVERAIIMSDMSVIHTENISNEITGFNDLSSQPSENNFSAPAATLDEVINNYIKHSLKMNNGNISKTAKQLNVSRSTIYNYLAKQQDEYKD